jgi:leucine dehydrogenase
VIAGAANNQLANESLHGKMLRDKNILFAPDFLINAGGVINCYREVQHLTETEANGLIENIYTKTLEIFKKSNEEQIPTSGSGN